MRRKAREARCSGGKLKPLAKKGKPISKIVEIDDFDLCVIRQAIYNFYTARKEYPTLKKVLVTLKTFIFLEAKTFVKRVEVDWFQI
jgi:hypothetical protein